MSLRLKLLIVLVLVVCANGALPAMACQGPFPYDFAHIPEMDVWVRASVLDVDDRGFSAILKVREYYKGEGPELLAVVRYPVGLETARGVRGYPTANCIYAGNGTPLIHGKRGYYGLKSNGDGTFSDALWNAAHYFFIDGEMDGEYYVDDPDGFMDEIVLSEAEFVSRLLEVGGRENAVEPVPAEESRYPLMRYLLVTLEDGTLLRVNPDRSVTLLGDEDPIAISPDGAHTIYRESEDTLVFNYIVGERFMPEDFRDQIKQPGHHAKFSPDSNMVAVWDDGHLAVYIYRDRGLPRDTDWGGRWYPGMALERAAAIDLLVEESKDLAIRWSADSSTIVWQDSRGIWHWNLFEEATPQMAPGVLNVEANKLVDVSRSGRYVSYRNGGAIRVYDSQTAALYRNAWVAPNESYINTGESSRDSEADDRPYTECRAPMNENCANGPLRPDRSQITEFPYLMELLGWVNCSEDNRCDVYGSSWHPSTILTGAGSSFGREITKIFYDVRQIAYDPFYEQPAVLRGDYQIELEFYDSDLFEIWYDIDESSLARFDYLNLENVVDSPIASIEWGQPIFYDTFMLTALEYLPRTVTIASGDSAPQTQVSDG